MVTTAKVTLDNTDGNTVTDDTPLNTAPVSATMHPIAPSYASQFKHLALSFPSENVLHVELKRSMSCSLTELLQ